MRPLSARFHDTEVAYIDALAAFYGSKNGTRWSRGDVLRRLLEKLPPPTEAGPIGEHVRNAHEAAYPKVAS